MNPLTDNSGKLHVCGACCTRLEQFGVRLGARTILENINLHMHCGELTAVIGPNGAGKTTLLRAMIGDVPHTGALRFVHHDKVESSKPLRIGYVPQKVEIDATSPTTVMDLFTAALTRRPVWMGASGPVRRQAGDALERVGAGSLTNCKLAEISMGQLQRVFLALALVPVPEILLLDEPVSGVDRAGTALFYETVSRMRTEFDLSILLVSHDLTAVAAVADRMILLDHTILCDGVPREVLLSPRIRETFGFGFTAEEIPEQRPATVALAHMESRPEGRKEPAL